ncbi:single-stranded DNA-binding protein [Solicola sp. PLA-1-18]|uniref:single-stranded DNA-binding protein n=1 Tax=Solicola sp. PLA-1-18 TaxID=3380532 RepID=UPI003B8275EC
MTNVLMGVVTQTPAASASRSGAPFADVMVRVDRQAEVGSGRWSPLDPAVCHVRAFGDLAGTVVGALAVDDVVVVVGSIVPGPWDPDEELDSVPRRIVADVVTRPLTDDG